VPEGDDQAGAVGHHKHAEGLTQPGHLEGGHGGVECGGSRALVGRRRKVRGRCFVTENLS
jgi:hypothetical protein